MKIPSSLVGAGLIGYAIIALLDAPAGLLSPLLEQASHGRVTLHSPAGSLWHGQGQLGLSDCPGPSQNLGLLSWRLAPGLPPTLYVSAPQLISQTVQITPTGLQLRLSSAQLDLPAAALSCLSPALKHAGLGGYLQARSNNLSIGPQGASGTVQMEWREAHSALAQAPLGSFGGSAELVGPEGRFKLQSVDGNPLKLQAEGQWTRRVLKLQGEASIAPQQQDTLSSLFNLLGRHLGGGHYELKIEQRWGRE